MTIHRTLKPAAAAVATLLAAVLLTACLNEDQQKSFDLLNQRRVKSGRRELVVHDLAQKKAQAWAEKMARERKMSHSNLRDGMGTCWRSLGENVGYASSIAAVHNLWWNSTPHRNNILGTQWNGVGVGVARASNGQWYLAHVFVQTC